MENVEMVCKDCLDKIHPNKGKWKKSDCQYAKFVKKGFGKKTVEHMWVAITRVDDDGVEGTVANEPVFPNSPNFGVEVFVKYEEIEDVM